MSWLAIIGWGFGIVFVGSVLLVFLMFVMPAIPLFNGAKAVNAKLSNQYYYQKGAVVYVSMGNFFSLGAHPIEGADPNTFEVLNYNYAKDRNGIYYQEELLSGLSDHNLQFFSPYTKFGDEQTAYSYVKDDKKVFYLGDEMKQADALSFEYLWGDYSLDKNYIFYGDKMMRPRGGSYDTIKGDEQADYIRVDDTVYYKGEKLVGVDTQHFRVLSKELSKDAYRVYYRGEAIDQADAQSFEPINNFFSKDKHRLYYEEKPLPHSDPHSYQYIDEYFSKDKHQVYYFSIIILGVDAMHFSSSDASRLQGSDYRLLFENEHEAQFVLKKNIEDSLEGFSTYHGDVYINNYKVHGAKSDGFLRLSSEDFFYRYGQKIFYLSLEVKGADAESFEVISGRFAKDKNHLYWMGDIVEGVDVKTFVYQEGIYAEERNDGKTYLVYPEKEM